MQRLQAYEFELIVDGERRRQMRRFSPGLSVCL